MRALFATKNFFAAYHRAPVVSLFHHLSNRAHAISCIGPVQKLSVVADVGGAVHAMKALAVFECVSNMPYPPHNQFNIVESNLLVHPYCVVSANAL